MSQLQLLSGSGLLALQRLVLEQQNHINHISNLSNILTQAYLTFEENYARLYVEHHALCECLNKAGLVTRTQLWEHVNSYLRAHSVASLLDQVRATQTISHFAGCASMDCFALASRCCMEALAAVGQHSHEYGAMSSHLPAGSHAGKKGASPANVLEQARATQTISHFAGCTSVKCLALASPCCMEGLAAAGKSLRSRGPTSSAWKGSSRGENGTSPALLQGIAQSQRTVDALSVAAGSATVCRFLLASKCGLRSKWLGRQQPRGAAAAAEHPPVVGHRSPEPCQETSWHYLNINSVSLTDIYSRLTGVPKKLPPETCRTPRCDFLALLQDLWQYSVIADTLSLTMDLDMVQRFRALSRAGNECMRGARTRMLQQPPTVGEAHQPRSVARATMDPDAVLRFPALSHAGNECMRGASTRMLQQPTTSACQEQSVEEPRRQPAEEDADALLAVDPDMVQRFCTLSRMLQQPPTASARQELSVAEGRGQPAEEGGEAVTSTMDPDMLQRFGAFSRAEKESLHMAYTRMLQLTPTTSAHKERSMAETSGQQAEEGRQRAEEGGQGAEGKSEGAASEGRRRAEEGGQGAEDKSEGAAGEGRHRAEEGGQGAEGKSEGAAGEGGGAQAASHLGSRNQEQSVAEAPRQRAKEGAPGLDAEGGGAGEGQQTAELRRGQLVCISGLKSRPDLNGAVGRLQHYGKFSGRWSLNLTSGECVRIRPENLHVSEGRSLLQRIVEDDGTQVVIQRIAGFTRQPGVSMMRVCGQAFVHLRSCGGKAGDSKIYVVGGHDGLRVLSSAEAFDPCAGEWEILPAMSVARVDPCVAVLKGRIYVCGGVDGNTLKPVPRMFHFTKLPVRCHAQKSVECFDPRGHCWQALPPMHEGRYAATSAVFRGRLFVCGGRNEFGVTKTMECFDPEEETWELQPCMRHPRFCMCSESTGRKLYVCGGCTLPSYQPRHTTYYLNLLSNRGQAEDPNDSLSFPLDQDGFRAYHEQQLVVEPTATAEYFDHIHQRWIQLLPMTYGARYNSATACLQGQLYVLGGIFVPDMDSPPSSIGAVRSFVERLTPNGWQRLPRMQRARAGASAVADRMQEKVIVCGGHDGTHALCCVESYDLAKGAWEMMQPMSVKRTAASATIVARALYVCGGRDETSSLDFCERLDLQTGLWVRISRLHKARFQVPAVVVSSR